MVPPKAIAALRLPPSQTQRRAALLNEELRRARRNELRNEFRREYRRRELLGKWAGSLAFLLVGAAFIYLVILAWRAFA